ncbi:hypothetical protein CUS38_08075 [Enterococcus faecium]|nr:hypothetical protein CUS38_08075 [Enterococcus faecium]ROX36401.1 hypothetical protein EGW27_03255 [Enterococcus faecium]ROX89199.1 hypothetical protein EGW47_03255 [Enterococcus faecium]ROY28491.1 hypothetical protein EGW58_02485 [Enterococcus faecium]ROY42206.1 hypothetical protein EGY01_02470 [Enterococcus faecium]
MNTVYPEVVSLPFNSESQEIISKTTSPVFGLVGLLSRSSYWESIYQKKECDIGHTPFFIFFETSFGTRQHTRQKIVKDRK